MLIRTSSIAALLVLISLVSADDCKNKQNCSMCIQSPSCIWCGKSGEFTYQDTTLARCRDRKGSTLDPWFVACGNDNIFAPENFFEIDLNEDLAQAGILKGSGSSGSGFSGSASGEQVIQMKPQRVSMRLRVQETMSMQVSYRQAEDYPVDLYYLMDLSKSMEDDKDSLSALGATLAHEMSILTKNFRLGFGSFVDKVVMPYVSTVPQKLIEPCQNCAGPYGYKNALKLNENADSFVNQVREAPVSGNLDAPEGGFDAIMQAVMCKEKIGWRSNARHLLLFSTDAGFHYAGDGKLGGIVKPNDGKCHLDADGYYTHSLQQDYPSVAQINQVAKQENINIIFAVTSQQSYVYTKLAEMIEGSSAGELTANSSNIVDLVKDEYSKITSKVELKDNATAPVNLKYFSKCKGTEEIETSVCGNLKVGDQVEFRVEITVDKCPDDRSLWKQQIEISPVALPDQLILDLEMLCDCDCEREGYSGREPNAPFCNYNGVYQCGVCKCNDGFYGRKCECGAETPLGLGTIDEKNCRETNYSKICSGQGTCSCGECKCNVRDNPLEIIDGPYCGCTNFLCERNNGELCSGPDHGVCDCNTCKCKPGWTGDVCDCQNSTVNCINHDTGEVCSKNGKCDCNQCKCFETEGGRFSGKWCEDCPLCHSKFKCEDFRECVQCRVYETGPLMEEPGQCERCALLYSNYTGRLVANYSITVHDWVQVENQEERHCSFFDENDCRFQFVYGYDENKEPVVRVQQTLECPPTIDILAIVLGVIAAIVAVGLALLLIWKILTTIHDRREYARFEKERMMAKWDAGENPIYIQATSTFKNPTYGRK